MTHERDVWVVNEIVKQLQGLGLVVVAVDLEKNRITVEVPTL